MQYNWADPRYAQYLQDSGATWIRTQAASISWTLNNVTRLHNMGFKVLLMVAYHLVHDPVNDTLATWQAAVHDILVACGPYIDAVECWNEPDIVAHQDSVMDGSPASYMTVLHAVHDEMATTGLWGKIPLVAGAVSNLKGDTAISRNLLAAIRALGSDDLCDIYSYHSYAHAAGSDAGAYYYRVKQVTGDSKPLWMTEIGRREADEAATPMMNTYLTQLKAINCPMVIVWEFFTHAQPTDPNLKMVDSSYTVYPLYKLFQSFARPTTSPHALTR
jgi:hypothetical protein